MILADLHNHSCLSPCASLEMSPKAIARAARGRGVALLALTDHNAARNCPAFGVACRREGIAPLFGMECCSAEEAHVLAIFGDVEGALAFGERLEGLLPPVALDRARFGDQVIVDEDDFVLGEVGVHLGNALPIGFDELCREIKAAGALCIPSHIDRPYYSATSQLGFLPDGPYDAVEIVKAESAGLARGYPVVTGSDAHSLDRVGRRPFLAHVDDDALRAGGDRLISALSKALAGIEVPGPGLRAE